MDSDVIKIELYIDGGKKIGEYKTGFSFPTRYERGTSVNDTMIIENSLLPEFVRGAGMKVVLLMHGGGRVARTCRVGMSVRGRASLTIVNSEVIQDKRRFYKVKIKEVCQIMKYERDSQVYRFETPVGGKLLDINIGGVFIELESVFPFEMDDILHLRAILNEKTFETRVKILRKQVIDQNTDGLEDAAENYGKSITGYGCIFVRLTGAQEDEVALFINRVQIIERRRRIEEGA